MSNFEVFWEHNKYAVVGNSVRKAFPRLTYGKLRSLGKKVYAVDSVLKEHEGQPVYQELSDLPEKIEAVVLELPSDETTDWICKANEAGIRNVWIHQRCETPEAIAKAEELKLNLYYGTCAVMYLSKGLSIHTFHRWLFRKIGKY